MNRFPTLSSERLVLNETTADDAQAVFELFSDKRVTEYYDLDVFDSIGQALDLIEGDSRKALDNQMLRWAVREKSSEDYIGSYIGGCGINRFEPDRHVAVIGYEFSRAFWGKGYATEAITSVIEFAFSSSCPSTVNRIEAYTMMGNLASESLLLKLGFKAEGILREHSFWKGRYHDLTLFSLLKKDHIAQQ
ncbi:GNAT family N-acetyltransferase [Shewanella atlantica]|uniref:N-acetyltransferase n=1 Tax=Shewanella atlantica TaxID=271099 RepID=A0A431W705_9GAMM|nr:GNAT family protein [Shewanella atlantica]RTR31279.1 N-acetyltransferase [Shewanella atlantica]